MVYFNIIVYFVNNLSENKENIQFIVCSSGYYIFLMMNSFHFSSLKAKYLSLVYKKLIVRKVIIFVTEIKTKIFKKMW